MCIRDRYYTAWQTMVFHKTKMCGAKPPSTEVLQMKLNHKVVRTVTTTAAVLGAAAMLSVGAFAAEADINDPRCV